MTADTARLIRLGGSSLPPEESKKPLHSSQRPLALQSTTALQEITKTVHQFSVKSTKKGEAAQPAAPSPSVPYACAELLLAIVTTNG